MYLVLTALLALNVSAEILHAFKILNKSITLSNQSMNEKLLKATEAFHELKLKTPKAKIYEPLMNESLRVGDQTIQLIDKIKEDLIAESNGPKHAGLDLRRAEDQSTPTRMMIEEGRGEELRQMLNRSYHQFESIFSGDRCDEEGNALFDDLDQTEFIKAIPLAEIPEYLTDKDGSTKKWTDKLFKEMPMAPTITLLNKFKNDLVSAQTASVEKLYRQVTRDDDPFDEYTLGLIPNGSRFIQGESYAAEVFLAASRSKSRPVVKVNGRTIDVKANGKAFHELLELNELGKHTFEYSIGYVNSFGEEEVEVRQHEITVIPPPDHVAVASPTKMNILYIGLENPIAASITGIPDSKVKLSLDQGNISKTGPGTYNVSVTQPGKAVMSFNAENQLGEPVSLKREFRVARIPDPTPVIDKRTGGNMQTGTWKAQQAVFAALDFFPFETRFEIVSFDMTHARAANPDIRICSNTGSRFESKCRTYQKEAEIGDIYYLDNIKARGPDGKVRTLSALSFKMI